MYDGAKRSEVRRSITEKVLNQVGWFDFFTINIGKRYYGPNLYNLYIGRIFGNQAPELHKIILSIVDNKVMPIPIIDQTAVSIINGIRLIKEKITSDNTYVHFQLKYNTTYQNKVVVFIDNVDYDDEINTDVIFFGENDTLPDGYTSFYEYTFKANSYFGGNETWPLS